MELTLRVTGFRSLKASFASETSARVAARCARAIVLGAAAAIVVSALLGGTARAQSACAQLGVDCSHKGSGGVWVPPVPPPTRVESDEERRERLERLAEARRERKEQREAAKREKQRQKEEAQRIAQKQADDRRQREVEAQLQRERAERQRIASEKQAALDAERQRLAAIEAQRLQANFNANKPGLVGGLKGADDRPSPGLMGTGGALGLKGADDARPAWDAKITDPQVKPHAKRLASVVPPLPMSQEEVGVTWKKIYLNDDRLANTADLVIAGWEVTGVLGGSMFAPYKVIMLAGKTFIAGENGAYMHLVKKEEDYDAALKFLKNPAQSQTFAHLVQDIRQGRPVPASADPAMVKAARAVTDPKLGNSGASIAWDAMMSREAVSAMLRKATLEVGSELLSQRAEKFLIDQEKRKVLFDSVRLEREQARKMLALNTTTTEQREQLKMVIKQADQLSSDIYKVEKVVTTGDGMVISDATDKVATFLLGEEAKMPEYK